MIIIKVKLFLCTHVVKVRGSVSAVSVFTRARVSRVSSEEKKRRGQT